MGTMAVGMDMHTKPQLCVSATVSGCEPCVDSWLQVDRGD